MKAPGVSICSAEQFNQQRTNSICTLTGTLGVLFPSPMIAGIKPTTIFDVAHHIDNLSGAHVGALKRIFDISGKSAGCIVGKELASKYKVPQDNKQYLVSITNRHASHFRKMQECQPYVLVSPFCL